MDQPTSALPTVDEGAHAADWVTSGGEMGDLVRSMEPNPPTSLNPVPTSGGRAARG